MLHKVSMIGTMIKTKNITIVNIPINIPPIKTLTTFYCFVNLILKHLSSPKYRYNKRHLLRT